MGIYDKHADSPDKIKIEGQEITLKFVRNGDGTGTITWNIPNISGCDINDIAYDGIVITVSDRPANYITTSPQKGTYYESDPTFDKDLHTGDKINVASVVGAFYHDKTTTSLLVTDVRDKTPYYVSAYAVDQIGNYHREGVHAYSLATGQDETDKSQDAQPAYHDIVVDTPDGIDVTASTGLNPTTNYTLKLLVNGQCITYDDLLGSDLQTFEDLAATINDRLKLEVDPLLGTDFPNTGEYWVDESNSIVYMWDGSADVAQTAIFADTDPAVPVLGSYWFNTDTEVLSIRESSGWVTVSNVIEYPTNPSDPADGTIWLDKVYDSSNNLDAVNTSAWVWNGNTWCKLPTVVSTRSPLLPPILVTNDYWYNTGTGSTYQRNVELRRWDEVDPIVWDTDPNTITNGNYWYNSDSDLVFIMIAGIWEELNNIRYEEANESGDISNPVANHYWFDPEQQRLFQRNLSNTAWVERNVIISFNDPADRASCDLWWNVSPSIDTLFHWDSVNNVWAAVNNFFQQATDPSLPATLANGTVWYNPETDILQRITGLNCTNVIFIDSAYDPTNLPIGVVWRDTTNSLWYIWDGSEFIELDVIESEADPYGVIDGILWYDTDDDELWLRVAGSWVQQTFATESLAPDMDAYFLNTLTQTLYQWNGSAWAEACGLAKIVLAFNRDVCFNNAPNVSPDLFSPYSDLDRFGRDIIRFQTCESGCDQKIEVDSTSSTVFTSLTVPVMWQYPATGRSISEAGPTYKELGVGDDGSPDERRKLQDQIRIALGSVGVTVELTKQQLDECIDNALLMVRKYSSYAYEHGLFFLDVLPNQQKYVLTNKCVGFNKIININAAYRMRGGFFGAAATNGGGSEMFAYAALQQLYSVGSFDMLSFHLVASYMEDLRYLFADNLVYTFYEDTRVLSFHKVFPRKERVLLDAFIELPEQRLMTNRYLALWIKKWSIAEAKMILSQVRGKYQSLPGPNGSTTLNSQELITQGENEKALLQEELFDRSMQDHNSDVMSQFFIG